MDLSNLQFTMYDEDYMSKRYGRVDRQLLYRHFPYTMCCIVLVIVNILLPVCLR